MSAKSFFKQVGVDLLKVLTLGDKAAEAAEPVIDLMFPAEATLYNGAVAEVGKLLASGQAAAASTTGALPTVSAVVSAVEPQLIAYAESIGAPAPTADKVNAYTQALLQGLAVLQAIESGAALPATVAAAPAASAAPASAAPAAVVTKAPATETASGLAAA
jgi:hypothetical protein